MHKRHWFFEKEGSYICFPGDLWTVWLNREKLKSLYKHKISSSEQQNNGEKIDFYRWELVNKYATTTRALDSKWFKVDDPKHHRATPVLIWYLFLLKYTYGESGFRVTEYRKEAQENKYVKQMQPLQKK